MIEDSPEEEEEEEICWRARVVLAEPASERSGALAGAAAGADAPAARRRGAAAEIKISELSSP